MSLEGSYAEHLGEVIAETAPFLSRIEVPPSAFTELAQELRPQLDALRASLEQFRADNNREVIFARQRETIPWFGYSAPAEIIARYELPETEEELHARVLPEVSEQELHEAVGQITAEPEKLELAAVLTNLLTRVPPVPAPWLVFVIVFWMAMHMNANEVGAVALALAVASTIKQDR